MTEDEAYKVHIQYTFNAFCKVVIRHAAIDKILKLRRRWEREVSLDSLKNVSLCVERGTTVGLVGANGSGKSVLFKMICGFEKIKAAVSYALNWE